MQKLLLLFVLLSGPFLVARAQETKQERPAKKGCSCSFSSINQLGMLTGKRGTGFTLQTINGFKYKTWFAGIGVGLDAYYKAGFPVFFDLRKDLLKTTNTPFIYADAGISFPFSKRSHGIWNGPDREFYKGPYTDVGLGFKFNSDPKIRWVISAGYSYKYVKYDEISGTDFVCVTYPCPSKSFLTYRNYLHRFAMRVGVQIW